MTLTKKKLRALYGQNNEFDWNTFKEKLNVFRLQNNQKEFN
jgi:hypothetical protein